MPKITLNGTACPMAAIPHTNTMDKQYAKNAATKVYRFLHPKNRAPNIVNLCGIVDKPNNLHDVDVQYIAPEIYDDFIQPGEASGLGKLFKKGKQGARIGMLRRMASGFSEENALGATMKEETAVRLYNLDQYDEYEYQLDKDEKLLQVLHYDYLSDGKLDGIFNLGKIEDFKNSLEDPATGKKNFKKAQKEIKKIAKQFYWTYTPELQYIIPDPNAPSSEGQPE